LLLARLQLDLFNEELQIFRFAAGAGMYSLVVLLLTASHLAYPGVFLASGLAVILVALRVRRADLVPLPDFSHAWKFLFALVMLGYGTFYFINALAPEVSPDGSTYHLGLVARYLSQHSLGRITTSIYASLSAGLEMLFLSAFSFGRHSSAALIELGFLVAIPLVMVAYARRFGFPKVGVAAALIVFCSPVFGIAGSSAYNDAGAALILFSLFYALQIWDETRQPGMLVIVGLLAGFGYGIKYTLFLATPYCLGLVAWKLVRARQPLLRPILVTAGCALLLIAPWWIKNSVTVGNPLAPFGNKIFSNRYVTPRFENDYIAGQKPTGPVIDRLIDATIRGGKWGGFLGPLFLLSPLGLLALRYKQGRQVLLAAGLFLVPAMTNGQTRFLMLAAPFVALALCLAVWKARGALLTFAVAAPVFACTAVADVYCDPWAWRLHEFPVADALRSINEATSLDNRLGGYRTVELINREVPPHGKIYAMGPPEEAYIKPQVLVSYQSAEGENLRDLLYVVVNPDFQPSWILDFRFSPQPLNAIRVVQTASGSGDEWSIGEMKFFDGGLQLAREAPWKWKSTANPWDLPYAFDNEPVTRWGARATLVRGMQIEVDFGHPEKLDRVELDCSHDQWAIRLKLEGKDASGNWRLLRAEPEKTDRPLAGNLRRPAMEQFKRHGITHLLLQKDNYVQADFEKHAGEWGVALAGQAGEDWLYVIK
jgi:hypothetical protein